MITAQSIGSSRKCSLGLILSNYCLLTFHWVYPACVHVCSASVRLGHSNYLLTGISQNGTSRDPVPSQMVSERAALKECCQFSTPSSRPPLAKSNTSLLPFPPPPPPPPPHTHTHTHNPHSPPPCEDSLWMRNEPLKNSSFYQIIFFFLCSGVQQVPASDDSLK